MSNPRYEPMTLRVACPDSEFSSQFLQGMLNRMAVSYFKYGLVVDAFPEKISAIDSLQQRLQSYVETGNTEYLIDAANFAMIEFMRPSLDNAHFTATDSDGSPGRIASDGRTLTSEHNDDL